MGQLGRVRNLNEVGVLVDFAKVRPFWLNPAALVRLASFSIGQPVRVKNDAYTINAMESYITAQKANKVSSVR